MHGEFDTFLEVVAVQRQGGNIESFGWTQAI